MKKTEIFEIVDDQDRVIGRASRTECHGNPALVHRVAHVLVFDKAGRLLLQKRSRDKDIQPGRWDTSVGGHLEPGESYLQAAYREMAEELGITGVSLTFLYRSSIRNAIESENVATFLASYEGKIVFAPEEIEETRFWPPEEIDAALGHEIFTPNFEEEWALWQAWSRRFPTASGERVAFCAGDSFPGILSRLESESDGDE